ncbi:MAG: alpha-glucuronidase family glycosyl hydrolase, partial [Acidobacteriaceae bacterium]
MVDRNRAFLAFVLIAGLSGTLAAHAENGSQGWLRYAPPSAAGIPSSYQSMPAAIVKLDASELAASAQSEMLRGVRSMLGRTLRVEATPPSGDAWVLGTTDELRAAFPQYRAPSLGPEGFAVSVLEAQGHHAWLIAGADARGILYG